MEIPTAYAGDIVSIAGFPGSTVAFTLNKLGNTEILPVNFNFSFLYWLTKIFLKSIPIDPPIMAVQIGSNTSPLAGKEGGIKLTYGQIKARL
jgi:GTP-binding protein